MLLVLEVLDLVKSIVFKMLSYRFRTRVMFSMFFPKIIEQSLRPSHLDSKLSLLLRRQRYIFSLLLMFRFAILGNNGLSSVKLT